MIRVAYPRRGGGPDVIVVERRPSPPPGRHEVLIATTFAGVNRHDVNQRARGSAPAGATDVLGLEVCGTISAVGADVPAERIGERVCALVDGGGYADMCVADARLALPLPSGMDEAHGAALPEALFTFWFNVVELGRLKAGDWLLVHGGTSGVGSMTIQVAKALGAHVVATGGSADKCQAALRFGADVAVDYRSEDFVTAAIQATGGRGVNVVLDMVGGAYAERNLAALAMDGRILHLASGSTPVWSAPLRAIMEKRAIITGSLLRPLEPDRKARIARALEETIWPLLGTRINPVIDSTFDLADAAQAHARMETGEHIGKIMLVCAGAAAQDR